MKTVKSVTQNGSNSTNTGAIGLLFLCLLLIFPTGNQAEEIPAASRSDTIEDTIKRSADYLVKATKNDGMFEYRINMDPTVKVNQKYNILRHAGTIYAMSMYHERHPDKQVRSAMAVSLLNTSLQWEDFKMDGNLSTIQVKPHWDY
jgi:hypothetical protein